MKFGLYAMAMAVGNLVPVGISHAQEPVKLDPVVLSEFIKNRCVKCHGPKKQKGKLRLDTLGLEIGASDHAQRWKDVYLALKDREMPPEDEPRPSKGALVPVLKHLQDTLKRAAERFGPGHQYRAGDIVIAAASPDEPRVESFNQNTVLAAAKYLDNGALAWMRKRKCMACHTTGTYMAERPALTPYFGSPKEEVFNKFRKGLPAKVQIGKGGGKRPVHMLIWKTLGLAQWDQHIAGKTSESTRRALRAMFAEQAGDGSWMGYQGVREIPHNTTRFELAVRAAWAASATPDWLDQVEDIALLNRVNRMMTYLRDHKPRNDYELALKLQVGNFLSDAVSVEHRKEAIAMLRRKQKSDGGWSLRSMSAIENWAEWKHPRDKRNLQMLRRETDEVKSASDPYMTGFAIVLLREAGIPKTDEQIQSGIAWLKRNQRVSGRWWMKSMYKETYHFTTYMGTAQALKALALCDELTASHEVE
jgi:squalene-hopene/tetraprenyl-beta-curcumene cyclase